MNVLDKTQYITVKKVHKLSFTFGCELVGLLWRFFKKEGRKSGADQEWQKVRPLVSARWDFSLYIGNITFDTTSEDLTRIFGAHGKITDVFVPWDPHLKRPRGFAFIRFLYEEDAHNAKGLFNGKWIDGRVVTVSDAKPREAGKKKGFICPKSNTHLPCSDEGIKSKPIYDN